jgi:hypothetical protein
MAKHKDGESFRRDRMWSATDDLDPDSCVTLQDKLAFQKELRRRIEEAELPSDLPWFPMSETRWFCSPNGLPPEYIQQQVQRRLKREQRRALNAR